jgi:hypothetical protein
MKYEDIEGWFNDKAQYFYDFLISEMPDNGIFVECGAWQGKSSAYLCDKSNNRFSIFIVDHWEGSKNEENVHKLAKETNLYLKFLENMGDRKFFPLKMESKRASECFNDNSCDIVYIDMGHTYKEVKRDIELWLPKVKSGGYISGHDYIEYNDIDWGVVRAVDEFFGNKAKTINDCWFYQKT